MIRDEQCIPLVPSLRDSAARVLAEAFQDDPVYRFIIPDDARRARDLPWLFRRVAQYSLLYGDAYTTPNVEGVASWLPPGGTKLTLGRMIRVGLPGIVPRFGWAAFQRMEDIMAHGDELHAQYAHAPHWYLWAIGVKTSSRGKGIGGLLMQPVLTSAGATGIPCYLETHNEINVPFYLKHGFRVMSESKIPKHGLRVWAMLRGT
jgi:ribosomal protein S18 acetylase RimI-like enzyme